MQKLVKKNIEKQPSKVKFTPRTKVFKHFKKKKKLSKYERVRKAKKAKSRKLIRKAFRRKVSGRPFKAYKLDGRKRFHRLTIRVVPNNTFCTLKDNPSNKVLKSVSGGSYKLKLSKKGLRYYSKLVVTMFLKDLRDMKIKFNKSLVVKVVAPIQIRKQIINVLTSLLFRKFSSKKTAILEVESKKVFNGCRPKKKVRKKRKGLRLFK